MEDIKTYINKNGPILFYALLIVFIIVIIAAVYIKNSQENDIMRGLWTADEDFCNKADVDGMMIFIGPPNGSGVTSFDEGWGGLNSTIRKAYLIMHAKEMIIANKKFTIVFSGSVLDYFNPLPQDTIYKTIRLVDKDCLDKVGMEDAIEDPSEMHISKIMPTKLKAKIEISRGKMTWTDDDDKVYAEFYKDNNASGYADYA